MFMSDVDRKTKMNMKFTRVSMCLTVSRETPNLYL